MESKVRVTNGGNLVLTTEMLHEIGAAAGDELTVRFTDQGLMLRRKDPPLTRVYVEPTNACNLSCRTCIRHSWQDETGFMAMGTYSRLIEGLRTVETVESVSFWGFGEPLMHPRIVAMVALAKELGVKTQMITNALLLDAHMSEQLVSAGLDSIVVSIDGASVETHADVRPGADLQQVRHNVDQLRKIRDLAGSSGPEIGLEFVLMRRNVRELRHLMRLARSLEATSLIVTHVLPYTEEMVHETLYGSTAGTCYPIEASKWTPQVLLPRMDWRRDLDAHIVELLQHSKQNNYPPERAPRARGYCPYVDRGSISVSWDGAVSPCISMMHSYSCYVLGRPKEIKKCVFGDLSRESITEIWNRPEYVAFRDRVRRFDFAPCTDCGGCALSATNESDCYGNDFPACGDCLWAKGVIQCP